MSQFLIQTTNWNVVIIIERIIKKSLRISTVIIKALSFTWIGIRCYIARGSNFGALKAERLTFLQWTESIAITTASAVNQFETLQRAAVEIVFAEGATARSSVGGKSADIWKNSSFNRKSIEIMSRIKPWPRKDPHWRSHCSSEWKRLALPSQPP